MPPKILFENKVIKLNKSGIKKVPTYILKKVRARANKEYKYLSQLDNPIDKFCANIWKKASDTISKELKRRAT